MKPHPLKVERELRGWSQAKVAEAVGTNVRTVIRWEQRQAVPSPHYRELLCELFAKNARELGLLEHSEASQSELRTPSRPLPGTLLDPTMPTVVTSAGWLVGRDAQLAQVKARLGVGGERARSALYGLPGMGKTTLAVAVATDEEVRARFEGVLWAGLGPEPDVISHLARWANLLGVSSADVEQVQQPASWARVLRSAIGQRRLLLVIDDAWQIEDALALHVGGSQCGYLLTTRLPQLAFSFAREQTCTLLELSEPEGLTLLAQFVPQVVQQDLEGSRALVRAVGVSPLALTLMGQYLAAQAFTGQTRRLHNALAQVRNTTQRLWVSMPVPAHTHFPSLPAGQPLSLQAVIAVSEQRVSQPARAALRALALFPPKPNSFSEEAALVICATSPETLNELWDAGLLESQGSRRYTLHQTIADYARAQGIDQSARQRFIAYFMAYLNAHLQEKEMLEDESANLVAALEEAFLHQLLPELVQGAQLYAPVLLAHGRIALAEILLQRALEATQTLGDGVAWSCLWLQMKRLEHQRKDALQAQAHWQHELPA